MQQIRFNTGRPYTKFGQRITATLHDDGVCTFNDHDRGVDGEYTPMANDFNRDSVMHAYDHNKAKGTHRSWQDAMRADGCNAVWREDANG